MRAANVMASLDSKPKSNSKLKLYFSVLVRLLGTVLQLRYSIPQHPNFRTSSNKVMIVYDCFWGRSTHRILHKLARNASRIPNDV